MHITHVEMLLWIDHGNSRCAMVRLFHLGDVVIFVINIDLIKEL